MKIEFAPLRSWWLGGVTVWAAAVWIATLLGAGGGIAAVDAGDRAAPPLPVLAPAAPERIASAAAYADIGARPLFAEDRKPRPYLLGGTEPGSASSAVTLTGVLLTSEFAMAILTTDQKQSLRLRLNGEAVNGWQLVALEPRSATVTGPGGTQTLELATFNGQGGEPPTVLGSATAGGPAQAPGMRAPLPPPHGTGQPTQTTAPVLVAPPPAAVQPAPGPPAQNAAAQGPSEEQMQAIRARIQARRQQLQQQQQSQQPPGSSGQTK